MLCRTLRRTLAVHGLLGGLLCLALLGSAALSTPSPFGPRETPSIGLRGPHVPLAALETTCAARFQKPAQAARWTLQKPERSGHLSAVQRAHLLPGLSLVSQGSPVLFRRFLPARHPTPRAPHDSGDPFPASSFLSEPLAAAQ